MRRALRWMSALVYAGALTVLLLQSHPEVPLPLFPHADKLAHFVAFGLLLYGGGGVGAILLGGNFLDYGVRAHDPVHGQHLGYN